MCINRSQRHCCLQGTLLFLLTISVITFGAIIAIYLGVYYSTEQQIGLRQQRDLKFLNHGDNNNLNTNNDNNNNPLLIENLINLKRLKRENNDENNESTLATMFFKKDCPWNQWLVQSSLMLDLCPYINDDRMPIDMMNDVQFKNCLRDSFWYLGIASIVPFVLTFITLIAVCRLWLCPIVTMAIVYLALAITLIVFAILFKSGSIMTDSWPLFIAIAILVCFYVLLSLLLLLLFSLILCERRRQNKRNTNGRPLKTNGTNDNDRMMMKMPDDDDEIDDPNVPLYHQKNGLYSQQKRSDFDDKIKDFKYIDDDMSYVYRRG